MPRAVAVHGLAGSAVMSSSPSPVNDWLQFGRRQLAAGSLRGAALYFRLALVVTPSDADALNDLGIANKAAGDPRLGIRAYRRAHAVATTDPGPLNNLGNALAAIGEREAASGAFIEALRLAPGLVEGHQNYGDNLRFLKRYDEASTSLRRALALRPEMTHAHMSLASVALALGEVPAAIAGYRRVLALAPSASLHSDLLFTLTYDDATTNDALFEEHRRWARRYAGEGKSIPAKRWARGRAGGKLRIGYLSADLRDHPVARNLIGLIEAHDRDRFDVLLYPELTAQDDVTERFRALADLWRPTQGVSDAALAELIRQDGVDVLVFVAPHTGTNRVSVAGPGAAPVQVSLYGLSTTGITRIDAVLTDSVLHPADTSERFVERLIRLPCLYLHEPPTELSPTSTRGNPVVFASYNNPAKHTPRVYRLWARILADTPDSRLRLKYRGVYRTPSLRRRIGNIFESNGVDSARLDFIADMEERGDHLAGLRDVDIALDPFPFNGCNTTFEALWMGVPVVTLAGDRLLSRMSASFLSQIGLSDLIAHDDDSYVAVAKALAADKARRVALRSQLRDRVIASRLCDPASYAREIEGAYIELWRDKFGVDGP